MQQITHINSLKQPLIAVTVPDIAKDIRLRVYGNLQFSVRYIKNNIIGVYAIEILGEVLSTKEISFDVEELVHWVDGKSRKNKSENVFISALIDAGVDFNYLAESKLKLVILQKK